MASKKYAYYNKGNKIAIIEQYDSTSSGKLAVAHCTIGGHSTKDACEAAGGQWIPGSSGSTNNLGKYQSPVGTVEDGLEIEYTYAPTYNLNTFNLKQEATQFVGYASDGDNLVLFSNKTTGRVDLSGLFAADEYIVISGSGIFDGVHQVKSAGTVSGSLVLKTKFSLTPSMITGDVTITTAEVVSPHDTDMSEKMLTWLHNISDRSNTYLYLEGTDDGDDDGLYTFTDTTAGGSTPFITLDTRYAYNASTGEITSAAAATSAATDDNVSIYHAYKQNIQVYKNPEVMIDETFELDLTRYQANAVTLYLKAKMFEDAGDIDKHEYYMRQFKKQLEKGSNARKSGPHIVQGHWSMRK